MKVSQAEDINKRFLAMRDTIDGMKADMDNLNKGMDALINKHNTYILKTNDSIYNLRKEMVLLGGQADWYRKEYFSMQYNTYSRLRQINIDNKILIGITATLTAIIALLK